MKSTGCKVLILICLMVSANAVVAGQNDVTRIAVISAFQPEVTVFLQKMEKVETRVINGRTFTSGRLAGKDVVVFLSGVSMINAAANAQAVIDNYQISRIVFSGIAGGVNPNLGIGDVVIPKRWANYQKQLFAQNKDGLGVMPWQTKELGHYNFIFPQYTSVTAKGQKPDQAVAKFWFDVDAKLLQTAQALAGSIALAKCSADNKCLEQTPSIKIGGLGVSGPTFVNNKSYREWVWENFSDRDKNRVDALDMESSAVATVAYMNQIPFIAFRSLSDLAGGGDHGNQLPVFFQLAADNASKVVLAFLENLE